ncbi:hypothetical protein jhhlp_002285 [Lomentospora prolificans]|uniref:Zn(2)-C6 fungal-type domain-containing protein n=1 Tax=Lomentospora prolificans TaxID=41688 RepID=A0A2N3NDV2_9PEZI|nr:hypothetical protein jhhlp_002285 [Lomentospora prolificans]
MPPRRSHKKSRAGCKRCKVRKIKCDEIHPRCGNCVKHGVPCDFENPAIIHELLAAVATAPTPGSASLDPVSPAPSNFTSSTSLPAPSPIPSHLSPDVQDMPQMFMPLPITTVAHVPTGSNRFLELRLMHHYTTHTSKTLATSINLSDDVWVNAVPKLAFEGATYLTDAMLAVAALHLRSRNPDDRDIVQASHAYMASSLAAYCDTLKAGINESNAEALFLTASLIAYQSTATRLFIRDDPNSSSLSTRSSYNLPLSWFHAFQGVKAVVVSSWQWIRNSHAVLSVIDSQPPLQLDPELRSASSFFGHLIEGIEDEIDIEDETDPQATRDAYFHAISVLNWAHRSPHTGACLAFPATVARRFVELIELKRPRALVILACFFALLKRAQHLWWIDGVPRREIMGVVSLFEPGSPWWPHLDWPLKIALYDGAAIPPEVWGFDWVAETNRAAHGYSPQTTFVEHIEVVAQMLSRPNPLPCGPSPSDQHMV